MEVLDVRGPSDEVLSEIALELSGKTVELRNKRIRSSDASVDLNSLSSEMRSSINTPSTPPSSRQPSGNTDSPSLESKMLASVHMTGKEYEVLDIRAKPVRRRLDNSILHSIAGFCHLLQATRVLAQFFHPTMVPVHSAPYKKGMWHICCVLFQSHQ